ncbi:MAG TPA: DMT family protein [Caulobacteraceae bacterium]|nr:DMT family protein [Caulobacteraceae bacterium]
MPAIPLRLLTPLMLVGSNIFMTVAWYGHLKFKAQPLWLVVPVSWSIAFFEYWLAVPANRWGSGVYSTAQLKAMQEVITLTVFSVFSMLYLGQRISWSQAAGFALIAAGAYFVFRSPASGPLDLGGQPFARH